MARELTIRRGLLTEGSILESVDIHLDDAIGFCTWDGGGGGRGHDQNDIVYNARLLLMLLLMLRTVLQLRLLLTIVKSMIFSANLKKEFSISITSGKVRARGTQCSALLGITMSC